MAGIKLISNQERDMIKLSNFNRDVIVGMLLSDGSIQLNRKSRSINGCLRFIQSLDRSQYVWFLFNILSHYCSSYPFLVIRTRAGVKSYGVEFFTRSLSCITELYTLFYVTNVKIIPQNIYELLTPVALAHLIMGDGVARPYGLQLCTDSYTLADIVRMMNVLTIRYGLSC